MLLSDFIDCVPHNQNIVLLIEVLEYSKSFESILTNRIDISKYQFENLEYIISSAVYDEYKDYYIDNVYAYRDTLYLYILDRG